MKIIIKVERLAKSSEGDGIDFEEAVAFAFVSIFQPIKIQTEIWRQQRSKERSVTVTATASYY
ncbi:hypothetical protein [Paenibacillus sp. FSL H8-0079]|uniref:hypothetical protein n=1 Tax=Paenibacillus sp. FSL H8-0079 TaxID=2921375 RepID=UPI0030EB7E23